jgi:gluconolactonase
MPSGLNRRSPNPLIGWQVDPTRIRTIGRDLSRPECVLAEADGSLWTADGRGGVVHIRPDGNQQLIIPVADSSLAGGANPGRGLVGGSLPNGLAFARNGDLLIANFGTDVLEVMTRSSQNNRFTVKSKVRGSDGCPSTVP